MIHLRILLAIPFLIYLTELKAQVTVNASADTSRILIGEPIKLGLSIKYPSGTTVEWPVIPEEFQVFELINQNSIRRSREGTAITERKTVSITSFDTGWHVIEPFIFRYSNETVNDSVKTDPILVYVATVAVDTTKEIKPIKGILEVERSWRDYIKHIVLALAVIALLILIWWWLKRRKKEQLAEPAPQQAKVPAHEWANQQLDLLEEQYRAGQMDVRTFYIRLSEIIRKYIFEITGIDTLEMTTNETIYALKNKTLFNKKAIEKLYGILSTADMAKFARSEPGSDTNLEMLSLSKEVVSLTKVTTEEGANERI